MVWIRCNVHQDEQGCEHVIQLLPADGWSAWYFEEETRERFSSPLVAWGLCCDGEVVPLDTDRFGMTEDPRSSSNFLGLYSAGNAPDDEAVKDAIERSQRLACARAGK